MICPNFNNEQVRKDFDEIRDAVGEIAAYDIWNQNEGNAIDKAPNGAESQLFTDLLDHFNGDRYKAVRAKAVIYSKSYKSANSWTEEPSMNDVLSFSQQPVYMSESDLVQLQDTEAIPEVLVTDAAKFTEARKELEKNSQEVKKGLKSRLDSVNRYSTRNLNTIEQLERLIDKLQREDSMQGLVDFIEHVEDTMNDSIKFLNGNIDDINSRQIVQLNRDYLGFYLPMLKNIQYLNDTTNILKSIPHYDEFSRAVDRLIATANAIENKRLHLLKYKTREFLKEYAISSGSPFVFEMIQWLENPKTDISWISYYMQSASTVDNEVIRIMENIIRNTKNKVERNTFNTGKDLVKALKEAQDSYSGDVMSLLQEKDRNGLPTGFFTRDRNYGLMNQDKKKEVDRLVQKLGIQIDEEGHFVFPDEQTEKQFEIEMNKWKAKYTNRRFKPEYYEERAKLSKVTRDALDEIQRNINYILDRVTEDGVIMSFKLSKQQLVRLDALLREKANLSNKYYLDGTPKHGEDLQIAQELSNFREKVSKKVSYKPDYTKFNKAAKAVRDKYGVDSAEYKYWLQLNTEEVYSQEFYDLLEQISEQKPESDPESEYEKAKQKRKEIIKLFREPGSLKVNIDAISKEQKEMIKQLDEEVERLKPNTATPEGQLKFSDVAEIAYTEQYYIDYRAARDASPEEFNRWFEDNHYENGFGQMVPISIYTYVKPKNSKYVTTRPNRFYQEVDEQSEWVDEDFDKDGEYMQPIKKYYDNSAEYNKIMSNPKVANLYNKLISTMQDSNRKISFLTNTNNYKLPQMTGRALSILGRGDNIFSDLKYIVKDAIEVRDDDSDYIESFSYRPDGTQVKNVVTRFIKMLDDPTKITSDVVGSVIQYFSMADNFREMTAIQDNLEMILENLSKLEIKEGNKQKMAGTLNVFKKAQSILDMNLYGKRKNQAEVTIGDKTFNVSKGLGAIYQYIGKINLGYNLWAIGTNYITGQGYTDIESILGRYYDINDISFAKRELMNNFADVVTNIGNVNNSNKLMTFMQYNQVTRSNEETFNRLDNSAALRAINQHFWYNGYTAGDFVIKSQILAAVYHNYKFVNRADFKGFMSKNDFINRYYADNRTEGENQFKQLTEILYDAYEVEDGKLKVKDKYKPYITTDLENRVKNKINSLAEKIDGNLSDTDRSAIHANAYAQFLVMHRNFMIAGIQDRFKGKQFNYNTGEIEEGLYRTFGRFFVQSFGKNKLAVLRQMCADYQNLTEWEQYNIKKVLIELANAAALSLVVSFLLIPAADDDKDNWGLQAISYVALRSAFEFRTLYNPMELTALLNSPSAAFSSITNAADMLKLLWIPNYFSDTNPFRPISSGIYEGFPKILRNVLKITPFKNAVEATDTKTIRAKRNYLENQLMY